ncbi:MAG: YqaE/Pmp3 family membrane protein [Halioglobus sp.]
MNKIVLLIIAIFLPPLAAYLQVGATKHLWINIILCLLFFVPGVLHALWLVLGGHKA